MPATQATASDLTISAANLTSLSMRHSNGAYDVGPDGESYTSLGDEWVTPETAGQLLGTTVHVLKVSEGDADGTVDADLVVKVADTWVDCSVTLGHEKGRPSVRGRHPLGTCGTPRYGWADDSLDRAIREAEEADEDFDPGNLIDEIEHAVDEAAIAADL